MVWVSNRSTGKITVSITTTTNSEGCGWNFTLEPKAHESWHDNCWPRSGDETARVTLSDGTSKVFDVGPKKFVSIYDDAIVMWDAEVTQLDSSSCVTA